MTDVPAEWRWTPLESALIAKRAPVRVNPGASYPNLGIYSFGKGCFEKPPISGDDTSAATLYRVREGQFIYSRLFAFEGAFGVVPESMDGSFVSNEYPTFDVDPEVALVEYVRILLTRPQAWRDLAGMTVGMGHRRQRLQPEALLAHHVLLPPVPVQRRIVDALGAVAAVEQASAGECAAMEALLAAARERLIGDVGLPMSELGSVLDGVDAGRSPKCPDRTPEPDEWGVLKVSSVRPGEFRSGEAKALPESEEPFTAAQVHVGDVLTVRGSGSPRFIGSVCKVREDPGKLLLSDLVLRLRFTSAVDTDYIVHAFATRVVRKQIEDETRGTTTLGKISRAILRSLSVPIPGIGTQRRIADELETIAESVRATRAAVDGVARMKSALTEALVSGRAEVDSEADVLLGKIR